MSKDNVNQPKHYTVGGIETIDYIKDKLGNNFKHYCIGNIIKYVSRAEYKNGLEDYQKAMVYLQWVIDTEQGNPLTKKN